MSYIFESYFCKKCGKQFHSSEKKFHELICKIPPQSLSKSTEININKKENNNKFNNKSIGLNIEAFEKFTCPFCHIQMYANEKEDHLKWHSSNNNQDGDILSIDGISNCLNIQSNYNFQNNPYDFNYFSFYSYSNYNVGMSNNIIDNLNVLIVDNTQRFVNELCIICLDKYNLDDFYTILPCHHFYHLECIKPWIRIKHKCPICLYELYA